jgi:hypothetical protein
MTDSRALRCAEAEFEAALMAASMAVDSEGRKIVLLSFPYRGWQPDAYKVTSQQIAEQLFGFMTRASGRGEGEVERRWVINARLILNAWEAALNYERLKVSP